MATKKFLIAGLGSIGRRHLKNLESLGEKNITLFRTHKSTISAGGLADYPVFTDLSAALADPPDAVIVSNPTALHMQVALPAAEAGCALLIEKPLAHQMDALMPFEKVVNQRNSIVLTAYQFRFNSGLQQIREMIAQETLGRPLSFQCTWGEYLPAWHPWEDYRHSYAANRDMGGGAVLTLSHPLDYLMWIFGNVAELFASTGNESDLELQCEDYADVILKFQSGVVGTLHLDYYRQPKRHDLEITCANGVICWDYKTSSVIVPDGNEKKRVFSPPTSFNRNQMFVDEMRHFIDCLEGKATPICDYEDGKKALKLGWGILQSGHYHKRVVFEGN